MKVFFGFVTAITFALTGLASCTEGGTLEITNDHSSAASVDVWFENEDMVPKEIGPGESKTWTFTKNGSVYYGYFFDDDYERDPMAAIRVLVMGGDVTRVTIKPQ
jgi:hypothetical protein